MVKVNNTSTFVWCFYKVSIDVIVENMDNC